MFIFAGTKIKYMNEYCTCTEEHGYPPWCKELSNYINGSFCALKGGLKSKHCPGAIRLQFGGRLIDNYFSSHPDVCSKSERNFGYVNWRNSNLFLNYASQWYNFNDLWNAKFILKFWYTVSIENGNFQAYLLFNCK